jgi:hypothetical protein
VVFGWRCLNGNNTIFEAFNVGQKGPVMSVNRSDTTSTTLKMSNTSIGHYAHTCLYYNYRAADTIRLTLSSQIAVSVWCRHPYRHGLFSSSVGSSDVLITDINNFCSYVNQVTLPSPTLDSFSSVL